MARFGKGKDFGDRGGRRNSRDRDGPGGDSGNRRDFRGSRSSRRDSGNRDSRREPTMHNVICDECGKNCEVPFKPTMGKPIFCSDCFKKKGDGNSNRGSGSGKDYSKEIAEINDKLDKIMSALEIN